LRVCLGDGLPGVVSISANSGSRIHGRLCTGRPQGLPGISQPRNPVNNAGLMRRRHVAASDVAVLLLLSEYLQIFVGWTNVEASWHSLRPCANLNANKSPKLSGWEANDESPRKGRPLVKRSVSGQGLDRPNKHSLLGQGADTVVQSMNCGSPSCVNLLSALSMGHGLDAKPSLCTCILKTRFTITTF
jgi:hypothetical protein